MDFLPIAFLVVFVLLGGIIALVADELGRRIGKRRLTLHRHLRPKTSARILAFLWGVFITIFTMVLIGLSSSDMRILLLRGRFAIKDIQSQRDAKQREVTLLKSQVKDLELHERAIAEKLRESDRKLRDAIARRSSAERAAAAAEGKAATAEARYAQLQPRLASIQSKYEHANGQIKVANQQLVERKQALAKAKEEYKYVYNDWRDLLDKQQELTVENDRLAKQIEDAKQELQAKNATIKALNGQIADIEKEKQDAEAKRDAAVSEMQDAQKRLQMVQNSAASGAMTARFSNVLFKTREELARVQVPAGTPKTQVLGKIEDALVRAREKAKEGGAKVYNGIQYAGMLPLPDGQGNNIPVETQKDVLASQVAGAPDDEVLIVYSLMNTFADESVPVAIAHLPNPIIYQPNQVLAEVRVDARQDLGKILETLNGLGDKIRDRAIKDKMIPGRDDSYGSFSSEDVLRLFSEIKQSGGSVRVQAVTRRETRAADPLVLDFKVR